MSFTLRPAAPADVDFLADMLVEAADWQHETPGTEAERRALVLAKDRVPLYVKDWARPGDFGLIAVDDEARPIGACWLRLYTSDDPAYGFVAVDVPELGIGIVKPWRGRGVGRMLLRETLVLASTRGLTRVSLSVDHANPAVGLYRSEGFVVVESRETAATMVRDLV